MGKAVLIIDMPECCDKCFALDESYDYPQCIITKEQRGYTFNTREKRMDKCPLVPIIEQEESDYKIYYQFGEYEKSLKEYMETKNIINNR